MYGGARTKTEDRKRIEQDEMQNCIGEEGSSPAARGHCLSTSADFSVFPRYFCVGLTERGGDHAEAPNHPHFDSSSENAARTENAKRKRS